MESVTKTDQNVSPQITGGSIDRRMASLNISPEIGNAIRRERETYAVHYAVRPSTVGGPVGVSTLNPTSTKAATSNAENGHGFLPTVNPKVQYGSLNRTKTKQNDASPFYRSFTTIDYPKHTLNGKGKTQTKENKDGVITDHRIRQLSNDEESAQPQSTYEFIRPTQRFWYPSLREQKHIWIEQSSAETKEPNIKEPGKGSNGKPIEHPKTSNGIDVRNSQLKEHIRNDSLSKINANLKKDGELRSLIDGPVDDDAVFEVQKKPILKPGIVYDNSLQRRNGIKYMNGNVQPHNISNFDTRTLETQKSVDKKRKSDSLASISGSNGSIENNNENDHLQYITVSRTMFPNTKPNNTSPVNTNHIRYAHLKSAIPKHEYRWRSDGSASTYSDASGSSDNSDKARKRCVRFSVSDVVHEYKSGDPVK